MREKIERYTRKLEGLSTEDLSRSAEKLVSFLRRNEAALIAHVVELSRRNGHLELGYESLFYYCVEHLHFGESSAWKRTQVAGVAARCPQVLEHLRAGARSRAGEEGPEEEARATTEAAGRGSGATLTFSGEVEHQEGRGEEAE